MSKTRYNLDLVFANIFFGANFSFYVSLTRNYLDFQQIFMLQVLSGAIFFIPFALFSKQSFRIRWRDAGNILIVTMLIVYGWMYMLLWGSSYTSPIDASIISTLGPAVTLIMDHIMHPHKYIKARVVGVVCALAGAAVLLFDHGFVLTHGSRAYGNALVLVAVVAIAINTVIIKPQLERLGTLVVMGWYYIVGLAVTAPFFWKYVDHTQFLRLPLQAQARTGLHPDPGDGVADVPALPGHRETDFGAYGPVPLYPARHRRHPGPRPRAGGVRCRQYRGAGLHLRGGRPGGDRV